ncbi:hypothetical protein HELRODRAFT_89616 [Helobdella robusta]|uniref:rRNA methyltransferase 2, mitochondrial n=1 Tax=Helobdella robusta TaxID=6412 RepID=T1G7F0_HELRO|nr:hypothetical protein HELRODRAFT_89616 [Helobdella robusta]ESN92314.1 hypothetical protein HELRODRAFT_89616 [Helobdella robusta]
MTGLSFIRFNFNNFALRKGFIKFHELSLKWYSKFGPTDIKGKNITAQKWLQRQMKDPYIRQAKQENYRCRSAYKLLEMNNKFEIFSPGQRVIDCGAAPGSWTQVVIERVNSSEKSGLVISVDLLDIEALDGAVTLGGCDFTKSETQDMIKKHLDTEKADVILSDMSPSASGIKSLDHDQSIKQVLSVFKFAMECLKEQGTLLVKVFQGSQLDGLINLLDKYFEKVQIVKPHASRVNSSEMYLLARRFFIR